MGEVSQVIASLRKLGKVDEVGKAFGVLKLRLGDEDFDISLPRRDSLTGDGHRGFDVSVDPHMSLMEATSRRDFTINALMYDHVNEYVVDLHGGLQDLYQKKLRHVSDAFDEDPLRVLRGVQMASRFGFTLHSDTVERSKTLKNGFNSLSTERVQIEFQKLYTKGLYASEGLKILRDTEWDENFPGLAKVNNSNLWGNVDRMEQIIRSSPELKADKEVLLSATIANSINDPSDRMKFLSLTSVGDRNKNVAFNLTTVAAPEPTRYGLRKWAFDAPNGVALRKWCVLQEARGIDVSSVKEVAQQVNVWDKREPDLIGGDDILSLTDKTPGPWVRNVLSATREAQYKEVFFDHDSALEWVKTSGVMGEKRD